VAGLNQAYRSLIPESVSGPLAGAKLESAGVGADCTAGRRTFFGVDGEWLRSNSERVRGVYDLELKPPYVAAPSGVLDYLDYEEESLALYLNHLAGRYWSFGAHYLLSRASLDSRTPRLEGLGIPGAESELSAVLNQLRLDATFHHSVGLFFQFGALWTTQSNEGYSPDMPGDDFWQLDVAGGYVFPRRRAQLSLGLLNLTDRDYRLNPLNLVATPPRERTFFAGLALSF
jgi:hypothetical protein